MNNKNNNYPRNSNNIMKNNYFTDFTNRKENFKQLIKLKNFQNKKNTFTPNTNQNKEIGNFNQEKIYETMLNIFNYNNLMMKNIQN